MQNINCYITENCIQNVFLQICRLSSIFNIQNIYIYISNWRPIHRVTARGGLICVSAHLWPRFFGGILQALVDSCDLLIVMVYSCLTITGHSYRSRFEIKIVNFHHTFLHDNDKTVLPRPIPGNMILVFYFVCHFCKRVIILYVNSFFCLNESCVGLLNWVWRRLRLYYCDGNFRFTWGLRARNRILVEIFVYRFCFVIRSGHDFTMNR